LRNGTEFRHLGERTTRPDPATGTAAEWRSYLYDRRNLADWTMEWWVHTAGCRRCVTVQRHTVTNEIRAADA
jgi:heterotetrameric sarcosine oxidase delta subunit